MRLSTPASLLNKHAQHESLESRVRGNLQARFGEGPTEKDHPRWYLAGGLLDSEGGCRRSTTVCGGNSVAAYPTPEVTLDTAGLRRLFRQFSTPGGIPSHVSVPTPGSIHEGGELGYVLAHAFGAAFDNPDLIVAAVVGDGEAETGPLAGSWQDIRFLNPRRDGAVLPILHLNGYKIASATVLGRSSDDALRAILEAHGYQAISSRAMSRCACTRRSP
jgi:phosphoketolase